GRGAPCPYPKHLFLTNAPATIQPGSDLLRHFELSNPSKTCSHKHHKPVLGAVAGLFAKPAGCNRQPSLPATGAEATALRPPLQDLQPPGSPGRSYREACRRTDLPGLRGN